jgi:hypothetical protein
MTNKKTAAEAKSKTVVADDPVDSKGRLKDLGGSQSDRWNNVLANQALHSRSRRQPARTCRATSFHESPR